MEINMAICFNSVITMIRMMWLLVLTTISIKDKISDIKSTKREFKRLE